MRIALVALGTRGDVQPLLALGRGLADAGYIVRIVTHEEFRPLATAIGLDFAPTAFDTRAFLSEGAGQEWLESGENPVRFILRFRRAVLPALPGVFAELRAATADAEVIVGATPGLLEGTLAEATGATHVRTSLVPLARTRAFPNITALPGKHLGGMLNALSHPVADQAYWQLFRTPIQRWRRSLGLPSLPLTGPYCGYERRCVLELNGFSPRVVPRPADWPAWRQVTGYWMFDDPAEAEPPAGLETFLASGPPPVYVGFGSMTPPNAPDLTALVRAALRAVGQRGVLLTGWGGIAGESGQSEDDLFVVERVAHGWLFPRVAAAVHHGGAGTTAAAIRAGVPNVVIPFFGDQRFWGWRIAALGLGPAPIQRQTLTVERLAAAIREATRPEARERAARFGELVAAEDGVANAVALFRDYVGRAAAR